VNKKTQTLLFGAGAAVVVLFFLRKQAAAAVNAVNPLNNENVISEGANEVLGLTDRGTSIGSFIFDLFNPEFDPNAATPPIR